MLAELLSQQQKWIVGYHEHDSLLENRPEEDLNEDERKAAWEEYEREKRGFFFHNQRPNFPTYPVPRPQMPRPQLPVGVKLNPLGLAAWQQAFSQGGQPHPTMPVPVTVNSDLKSKHRPLLYSSH